MNYISQNNDFQDGAGLRIGFINLSTIRFSKDNPYKYFSHDDLHQFFVDTDLKKEIDKKWGSFNLGFRKNK